MLNFNKYLLLGSKREWKTSEKKKILHFFRCEEVLEIYLKIILLKIL
jgi:hypothetical protein